MARYRSVEEILGFYNKRWNELGIEEKTEALRQKTGIHNDKEMETVLLSDPARAGRAEAEFKQLQIPAFIQIVGEMHHLNGWKDVGLGNKPGGNRWEIPGGSVAVDIINLKDLDGGPQLKMYDAMGSGGGPQAKPAMSEDHWNPERTFVVPPTPSGGGGGGGEVDDTNTGGDTDTKTELAEIKRTLLELRGRLDAIPSGVNSDQVHDMIQNIITQHLEVYVDAQPAGPKVAVPTLLRSFFGGVREVDLNHDHEILVTIKLFGKEVRTWRGVAKAPTPVIEGQEPGSSRSSSGQSED